jgi:replication factor C small subunit
MIQLKELLLTEKFRPKNIVELILDFDQKKRLEKYIDSNNIPSFIFYSSSAGTGKTSTAKIIIKELGCDYLILNSSDERGIDTIREKVNLFAQSVSTNDKKRCVFMDESDGLTRFSQDSLRNLMETYSDNCFFILSCNDISKIIEPLQSRCVLFNFEKPPYAQIEERLLYICDKEEISLDMDIIDFINIFYPDIRNMVKTLQEVKLSGKLGLKEKTNYKEVLERINKKDIKYIYEKTYSGNLDMLGFTKWLFKYLFENYDRIGFKKCKMISGYLADIEKSWRMNVNLEVIFLSNILKIMEVV